MPLSTTLANATASMARATAAAGMLNLLRGGLLVLLLACGLTASAQTVSTTNNFTVGAVVPDEDPSGLASAKTI